MSLEGANNYKMLDSVARILNSNTYKDLSTVWVTPSPDGKLDAQVVFQSWLSMAMPMNQKFMRVAIANGEVGKAYDAAVEMILRDETKWKYMLTVEHDNLPPRDGLLKLYESIDKYDAIGGLYWTKGENGTPMIYGHPDDEDFSMVPQVPQPDVVQACLGLGMGFTLFNVDMFRKIPKPWFHTADKVEDGEHTQDLYFFKKAAIYGYKFASDNRVKVGHMDLKTRKIW